MYYRSADQPTYLPENYSGCAFSPAKPTPPAESESVIHQHPKEQPSPPPTYLFPMEKGLPATLLQGLGSDDLLLLGLILLLSGSTQNRETVLWLTLLLFCG